MNISITYELKAIKVSGQLKNSYLNWRCDTKNRYDITSQELHTA